MEKKVTPLLPQEIGLGKIRYARGIKAGRWVFATGVMGTDFISGLAPGIVQPSHPLHGKPKNVKEAEVIFENLKAVAMAAGCHISDMVRLDQYYTTWKAVDSYHNVRRATFGDYIPVSTSVIQEGFLLAEAEMEIQAMGLIPESEFQVRPVHASDLPVAVTSGYAPVVRAGDYVFVPGCQANDMTGIAEEAKLRYGQRWGGTQIKLEAEYILNKKIKPSLEAGNSSLDNLVKLQCHISDVDDIPALNETLRKHFPVAPPVVTMIPTTGFARPEGKIEINAIALAINGQTRKEIIRSDVFTPYEHQSVAIRAGDLLFISGLMAVDSNGIIPTAAVDPRQPFFVSSIKEQMEDILVSAEKICRDAETSLENVVRIQQYHTNLNEFYSAYEVWQKHLPGAYLPFSAVRVPAPMPVPGSLVQVDLWVYVP